MRLYCAKILSIFAKSKIRHSAQFAKGPNPKLEKICQKFAKINFLQGVPKLATFGTVLQNINFELVFHEKPPKWVSDF